MASQEGPGAYVAEIEKGMEAADGEAEGMASEAAKGGSAAPPKSSVSSAVRTPASIPLQLVQHRQPAAAIKI